MNINIKLTLSVVFGIIGYVIINILIRDMIPEGGGTTASLITNVVPILFAVSVIIVVIRGMGVDKGDEAGFSWRDYGERLKKAYTAKFGGDNPGFESEVDYRIKLMVDTDKGYHREVAKDWLKRMSKFVAIDWLSLEDSDTKR